MKAYGIPRVKLLLWEPDLKDLGTFGLKSSVGYPVGVNGRDRHSINRKAKHNVRRAWKKVARAKSKLEIREAINLAF